MDYVKMIGLALDGSGVMKQLDVHPNNVAAFKASGYTVGTLPEKEWSNDLGAVSYTLEDSEAQLGKAEATNGTRGRPRGRR